MADTSSLSTRLPSIVGRGIAGQELVGVEVDELTVDVRGEGNIGMP